MPDQVYQAILALSVPEEHRAESLEIFRWAVANISTLAGLKQAYLCHESCEPACLRLVTEWTSRVALDRFLRSAHFKKALTAAEVAEAHPRVQVRTYDEIGGMDYVVALHNSGDGDR